MKEEHEVLLRNSWKLLVNDAEYLLWTTARSSGQKVAVLSKKISTNLWQWQNKSNMT